MSDDTLKIFLWPDGTWISEEDVEGDDFDWYLMGAGKSDDFAEYEVSLDLEPDDIQELIDLKALPGMLPDIVPADPQDIANMGVITIPEGAVLVVHHSKDIEYNAVTMLEDRLIVNAPDITIEVIIPKEKK